MSALLSMENITKRSEQVAYFRNSQKQSYGISPSPSNRANVWACKVHLVQVKLQSHDSQRDQT